MLEEGSKFLSEVANNKVSASLITTFIGGLLGLFLGRFSELGKLSDAMLVKANKPDEKIQAFIREDDEANLEKYITNLDAENQRSARDDVAVFRIFNRYAFNDSFTGLYKRTLLALNSWLSSLLNCKPSIVFINDQKRVSLPSILSNESLAFCQKLALFYPLLFMHIGWFFGSEGAVGDFIILANVSSVEKASLSFLSALSAFIFIQILNESLGKSRYYLCNIAFVTLGVTMFFFQDVMGIALILYVLYFLLFLFFFDSKNIVSFLLVETVLVTGFLYLSTGQFWFFAIGAVASFYLVSDDHKKIVNTTLFNIFYSLNLIFWLFLASVTTSIINDEFLKIIVAIPIVFGFLPLFNSFVDWFSLSITRKFLFEIYFDVHSFRRVLRLIFLDVFFAIFFMLLIIAILAMVLASLNSLSFFINGRVIFDFATLMRGVINSGSFVDNLWIYGMLFSTVFPTVMHLVFAVFALFVSILNKNSSEVVSRFYTDTGARFKFKRKLLFAYFLTGITASLLVIGIYAMLICSNSVLILLWHWADLVIGIFDSSYNGVNFP